MIARILMMLATCFIPFAATGADEPFFADSPVYVGGLDGYDTFRIPAMAVTGNGTVLAFAEGRKGGTSDTGDIDLVLKWSFDGGRIWQPMQMVWDDGPNTCGNPCPVVDRETGRVLLLITHNLGTDSEREIWDGTSEGGRTVRLMWSDDDGATWQGPREITGDVKQDDWTWYATGPGVGIQLRSGRLMIPCDHGVAVTKDYHSHVIYSDDHGETWHIGGTVPDSSTSECQVVERDDGSLLLNIRSYPERPGCRVVSESGDGGMTWSETRLDEALVSPGCQGSILTYSRAGNGERRRTIFSVPAHRTDRVDMTISLSYDGGGSWPVSKQVFPHHAAYSCLTVLPDGLIGCFYEGGEAHPYQRISFARFNLEWLTGGAESAGGRGR